MSSQEFSRKYFENIIESVLKDLEKSDLYSRVMCLNLSNFEFKQEVCILGIKQITIVLDKFMKNAHLYFKDYGVKRVKLEVYSDLFQNRISKDILHICDMQFIIVDSKYCTSELYFTLPLSYYSISPNVNILGNIVKVEPISDFSSLRQCYDIWKSCLNKFIPLIRYGKLYIEDLRLIEKYFSEYNLTVSNYFNLNTLLSQCIKLGEGVRTLKVEIFVSDIENISVDIQFCKNMVDLSVYFKDISISLVSLPFN